MARKKLRTIGHRVVRELERKLPEHLQKQYENEFSNYKKTLNQERNSKDKIYSLHEPQTACIAKGKAHKAGTKVAVVRGRKTGVITSVKRFSGNPHDSKTLEESLAQSERVRKHIGGTRPEIAGDIHNALLAGIGYNLKLRFNQIKEQIIFCLNQLFNFSAENNILIFVEIKNSSF